MGRSEVGRCMRRLVGRRGVGGRWEGPFCGRGDAGSVVRISNECTHIF